MGKEKGRDVGVSDWAQFLGGACRVGEGLSVLRIEGTSREVFSPRPTHLYTQAGRALTASGKVKGRHP